MALSKTTWENYVTIKHIVGRNPYATLQIIGNAIGLTRERVRQIIAEANRNPDIEPIERIQRGGRFDAYCIECDKYLRRTRKVYENGSKKCRECAKAKPIVFFCSGCGNKVIKSTSREITMWKSNKKNAKNPLVNFCSTKCSGYWLGMNRGFGATKKRS